MERHGKGGIQNRKLADLSKIYVVGYRTTFARSPPPLIPVRAMPGVKASGDEAAAIAAGQSLPGERAQRRTSAGVGVGGCYLACVALTIVNPATPKVPSRKADHLGGG